MKKIMFFMVAALAWVVTACSKDEAVISNNENLIKEISLSIEGSNSRMAYEATAAGLKFTWADGDPVYVFPAEADNHTGHIPPFIVPDGLETKIPYIRQSQRAVFLPVSVEIVLFHNHLLKRMLVTNVAIETAREPEETSMPVILRALSSVVD